MARLVITEPGGEVKIFEITGAGVEMGRAETNHLVLNHPSVSRHHTRIVMRPNEPDLLMDLGSLNGTFVNDQRIQDHPLADQDVVQIGAFQIVYETAADRPMHVEAAPPSPELTGLMSQASLDAVLRAEAAKAPREAEVDSEVRLQTLERENKLLRLLMGVGKVLSSVMTSDEAIRRAMELAFRMENVERGFVMLVDEEGKGFKPAVMLYKDENLKTDSRGVALSRRMVQRVMDERLPLLIHDVATDDRFSGSDSLRMSGVRSAMCAPLIYEQNLFGLFYVDCLTKTFAFSKEELNIFAVIASEAAMAFENARAHEELTRRLAERKALERFLSSAVLDKIQANPDSVHLGGENQIVTMLFADIRGFTRMSENMEPSAVVELLNEYFSEMTEIVFEFGGTLDKYLGDGLMALFGTPLVRPDDVQRAVRTAIEMQWALRRLNKQWQAQGRNILEAGIGINTGPVTAGSIGSPRRMDYTVIGDAVNLSSRLCARAKPGQILISDSTFKGMGRSFDSKKLEPIQVKGKEKPVLVHEVLWQQYFLPSSATAAS